jgi:hypothetical protein
MECSTSKKPKPSTADQHQPLVTEVASGKLELCHIPRRPSRVRTCLRPTQLPLKATESGTVHHPPRPMGVKVGFWGMVVGVFGVALVSACTSAKPAATQMTITYPVSRSERSATAVKGSCPAQARCRVESIPHVSPRRWVLVGRRSLRCGPASGGYPNPAVACRALADLNRLRRHQPEIVCACPGVPLGVAATARGRVNGRPATVPLDFCSHCGLGGNAVRDLQVLTPGAT